MCDLSRWFPAGSALRLEHEATAAWKQLRPLEPSLVSHADEVRGRPGTDQDALAIWDAEGPVAGANYVVETNDRKSPPRNRYGRLDIVIVHPRARGIGLGRVVSLAVLVHALTAHGAALYSLSTLAAHEAIAHITAGLGFQVGASHSGNYTQLAHALDDADQEPLLHDWRERFAEAARLTLYRLRQQGNG